MLTHDDDNVVVKGFGSTLQGVLVWGEYFNDILMALLVLAIFVRLYECFFVGFQE